MSRGKNGRVNVVIVRSDPVIGASVESCRVPGVALRATTPTISVGCHRDIWGGSGMRTVNHGFAV
jgi:hypothetical protein